MTVMKKGTGDASPEKIRTAAANDERESRQKDKGGSERLLEKGFGARFALDKAHE